jgi:dihydrofolate reductase
VLRESMNAIVITDKNWGIGFKGRLQYHLSADLDYFYRKTKNKTVIMGRKTLETLPGRQPLKERDNIILSRKKGLEIKNARVLGSKREVLDAVEKKDTEEVYVIGGDEIYRLFLPLCTRVFVTKVDDTKEADSFFPDLDKSDQWKKISESNSVTEQGVKFTFIEYGRIKK